jgi:hypothetical protein
MGRQIQIAMTRIDEDAFLRFVRKTAEIRIFGIFTQTQDLLWVNSFDETLTGHWIYSLWNLKFPWDPTYGQVTRAKDPKDNGKWYVSNTNVAPIIELTRSAVDERKYGRLYWGKDFSAPKGLGYDVEAFGKWFDMVIRWVRKNGQRDRTDRSSPYFLPDAWKNRKTN